MGVEMMVQTFDLVGIGQWFRDVTGNIEIGSAILLWVPGLQAPGAAALLSTMIGAAIAHLTVLPRPAFAAIVPGLPTAIRMDRSRDQLSFNRA